MSAAEERRESALNTGASSGVGSALALALAPLCRRVLLVGRSAPRLAEVAHGVALAGAAAECFSVDLAERDGPATLAGAVSARLAELGVSRLDVLVHSAGLFVSGPLATTPEPEIEQTLDLNLRAPFLLTRALHPLLIAGRGDVVFINSSVVGQRRAGLAAYSASKHGLVGLADNLRQELNPSGVRVLSVFLGATATPMQEQIHAQSGRSYQPDALLSADDVARVVCDVIRLPRGAEVTDLHVRPATAHRPA
jgi:NAD(P)-dependent dehydrogenase (short-subunit alcohol dehydrogenase family)